jgi:BASS family bile acid:Na+ symporter
VTLQAAILFGLKASIMLSVFALGLHVAARNATHLLRHPQKLMRSLVAMDLVMPAFAVLAIAVTPALPAPVKIALAALSVSPIPPIMPGKAMKAGGTEEYVIGLLVAASVIALVFVPLAVELLGAIFGVQTHIPFGKVASVMLLTVLGPLAAGFAVRNLWPDLALRAARPLATAATVLLLLCTMPVVLTLWPQTMSLIGNGTLVVFAAFVAVGLVAGHLLGGPEPEDRTVLAIATASRHPGVAISIAAINFPEQKLATAAVLLYLLVSIVISMPYTIWRKRLATAGTRP